MNVRTNVCACHEQWWLHTDCGAGIGRVTKYLLLPLFETVDLVEQNPAFLDEAKKYIGSDRVGDYYAVGLQG